MCVCEMADLPCRSVAIIKTCSTNSEHSDEIKTRGKGNFENGFLEQVS